MRECRSDVSFVQSSDNKWAALPGISLAIIGEDDFNTRAWQTQICDVAKRVNVRCSHCPEQASPRQDHSHAICHASQLSREHIQRFRDTYEV